MREKVLPIMKGYKIDYVAVFGSYARGEETAKSDLDLLVNFSKPVTYFDILEMEDKIAKKIKISKVDLVTINALHPYIKKYVEKDLIIIHDSRR